jgi:hypothetical protein
VGVRSQAWTVPGAGHFYAAERRAIDAQGRATAVGAVVAAFLNEALGVDQGL